MKTFWAIGLWTCAVKKRTYGIFSQSFFRFYYLFILLRCNCDTTFMQILKVYTYIVYSQSIHVIHIAFIMFTYVLYCIVIHYYIIFVKPILCLLYFKCQKSYVTNKFPSLTIKFFSILFHYILILNFSDQNGSRFQKVKVVRPKVHQTWTFGV